MRLIGTTLNISEARKRFNTLDEQLEKNCVITITRHNKNAFAVVNTEYLSAIMETLEVLSDPDAIRMLQESIEDIRAGRVYDQRDVEEGFHA